MLVAALIESSEEINGAVIIKVKHSFFKLSSQSKSRPAVSTLRLHECIPLRNAQTFLTDHFRPYVHSLIWNTSAPTHTHTHSNTHTHKQPPRSPSWVGAFELWRPADSSQMRLFSLSFLPPPRCSWSNCSPLVATIPVCTCQSNSLRYRSVHPHPPKSTAHHPSHHTDAPFLHLHVGPHTPTDWLKKC